MSLKNNYSHTLRACRVAYIIQAITVSFPPLLFLTFMREFSISLSQINALIITTFAIQLGVDLLATEFLDKIGHRTCAVVSHILAAIGFVMLGILPYILPEPFIAILFACFFYSCGSGMIEVLISPVVESCPTENKAAQMGLMHSFFCWGTAIVILVSTLFFVIFKIENWRYMSILWAILPIINMIFFIFVPINQIQQSDNNGGLKILSLLSHKFIWVVVLLMSCGGAAELAMSQWASAFSESALNVPKSVGDIAGPFIFAVTMGTGRVFYSFFIHKINLLKYITVCAVISVIAYLTTALCTVPAIALPGCAVTGFSVGVFWPGTLSYAAQKFPEGGSAMFALLAFAGDTGCTIGPCLVGAVSGLFGDNLKIGLLSASIFPALLILGIMLCKRTKIKK